MPRTAAFGLVALLAISLEQFKRAVAEAVKPPGGG
jgi:hypothetical protein